jgi:hypothetical protein
LYCSWVRGALTGYLARMKHNHTCLGGGEKLCVQAAQCDIRLVIGLLGQSKLTWFIWREGSLHPADLVSPPRGRSGEAQVSQGGRTAGLDPWLASEMVPLRCQLGVPLEVPLLSHFSALRLPLPRLPRPVPPVSPPFLPASPLCPLLPLLLTFEFMVNACASTVNAAFRCGK